MVLYPAMTAANDELSERLLEIAKAFYEVGERYHAISVLKPDPEDIKSAAQNYRDVGLAYLAALSDFERAFSSSTPDENLELELKEVRTRQHVITAILKHL
jgi:hypothetical protein